MGRDDCFLFATRCRLSKKKHQQNVFFIFCRLDGWSVLRFGCAVNGCRIRVWFNRCTADWLQSRFRWLIALWCHFIVDCCYSKCVCSKISNECHTTMLCSPFMYLTIMVWTVLIAQNWYDLLKNSSECCMFILLFFLLVCGHFLIYNFQLSAVGCRKAESLDFFFSHLIY